jgi:hypothetical protein
MTDQTDAAKPQTRLVVLLFVSMILAIGVVTVVGYRFLMPEELVYSAGLVDDYDWREPEYVPLDADLILYLDRMGDELVALSAKSTTSDCGINWLEDLGSFMDPCCGSRWARDGQAIFGPALNFGPLPRYAAGLSSEGEILVYPWRDAAPDKPGGC